jgi:hypothetical protein
MSCLRYMAPEHHTTLIKMHADSYHHIQLGAITLFTVMTISQLKTEPASFVQSVKMLIIAVQIRTSVIRDF